MGGSGGTGGESGMAVGEVAGGGGRGRGRGRIWSGASKGGGESGGRGGVRIRGLAATRRCSESGTTGTTARDIAGRGSRSPAHRNPASF